MTVSGVTSYTASGTAGNALAAGTRRYVRITNEHATQTIAVNWNTTALLNSTGGSITLSGFNSGNNRIEFKHPPDSPLSIVASGSNTPVTVEEY